jgi:hypothetical protein
VTRSLVNLFIRPLRAFARTLGFGVPPEKASGQEFLDATADTHSELNHALHRPAEGPVPIKHYDELTAHDAVIAIQTLGSSDAVRATLRHERAGKNRRTVQDAGERRLAELTT